MWDSGLSCAGGALWVYEDYCGVKSNWFVLSRPLMTYLKEEYYEWCRENCLGSVICYSTDQENNQEWWGFTHKDDILFWILKWM